MIDQILADAGQVRRHGDAVFAQVIGRADPRQHQQLGRDQRARGHDHLAARIAFLQGAGLVTPLDADGAAVFDQDPLDPRFKAQGQARVALKRRQKGIGGGRTPAMPVHELVKPDAALRGAVEIGVEGLAQSLHRLHEPARHLVDMPGVRDLHLAARAVIVVQQAVVVLHAAKMRQDRFPRPVGAVIVAAQLCVPGIVIRGPPAHIDLRVDRRAAPQHVPLGNVVRAPVQMRLRHGRVVFHELRAVDHLEDARWHVQQRVTVGMPPLQQQDAAAALRHKLARRHAAGRAATDNDMVEFLARHGIVLSFDMRMGCRNARGVRCRRTCPAHIPTRRSDARSAPPRRHRGHGHGSPDRCRNGAGNSPGCARASVPS